MGGGCREANTQGVRLESLPLVGICVPAGVILGLSRDNRKENGNCHVGFTVWGVADWSIGVSNSEVAGAGALSQKSSAS